MSRLITDVLPQDSHSLEEETKYDPLSFEKRMSDIELSIERCERQEDAFEYLEILEKSLESTEQLMEQFSSESIDPDTYKQVQAYCKSMLSYQLEDTSLELDDLSQEGIRDRIKSIKSALGDFVSNLRGDVSSSFEDIKGAHQSLIDRHKELKKRLSKADAGNVDKDKVSVSGCDRVHYNGDCDPSSVSSGLSKTSSTLQSAINSFIKNIVESRKLFHQRALSLVNQDKDRANEIKEKEFDLVDNYRETIEQLSNQPLSGGNSLNAGRSDIQLKISTDSSVDDVSSSQKIDADNVDDVGNVLSATKNMIDALSKSIQNNEKLLSEIEKLIEDYTQEILENTGDEDSEFAKKFTEKNVTNEINKYFKRSLKQLVSVQQYGLRTANSAMDYTEKVIEEIEE